MAQIYVPGPALIYVGVANSQGVTPEFFGTGETAPDVDVNGSLIPVMNDLGGTTLPFDRIWDGEEAMISVVINRFNWATMRKLLARPNFRRVAPTPGTSISGDIGTLIGGEGMTYNLWLQWTYATKASMSGGAPEGPMPGGFRFFSAFMSYPTKMPGGTKDQKNSCIFQCQRGFGIPGGAGNGIPVGNFGLYDWDMSALPATIPN